MGEWQNGVWVNGVWVNDRMTSNRLMVSSFPTTSFSLVGLYFSILQCTEEYGENTGHAAKYGYSRYQGSSCVAFLAGFEVSADFEALPSPAAAEESSIGSSPSSAIFSREVRGSQGLRMRVTIANTLKLGRWPGTDELCVLPNKKRKVCWTWRVYPDAYCYWELPWLCVWDVAGYLITPTLTVSKEFQHTHFEACY